MWKWTNSEDIKVIILDLDSLDDEYISYPYEEYFPKMKKCLVQKYADSYSFKNTIIYFDTLELLSEIINEETPSDSIIAISSDVLFLKEMMQYHIGTIYAGAFSKENIKNIPDFRVQNSDIVKRVLDQDRLGYAAEVISSGIQGKGKVYPRFRVEIGLDNDESRISEIIFGGRYFSKNHNFYLDDPLTITLLQFKYRYIESIDEYYDHAICFLNNQEKVDILCSVPLKPKDIIEQKFDRFSSLKLQRCKEKGIKLTNVLKGIKDFSQKKNDVYYRKESVKDAFSLLEDVSGKHVVILDDVYTSGATLDEIIKLLYENGAQKVTAIVLAVNQLTESMACEYKSIKCPRCNGQLILRISSANKLFFGCSNYSEGCKYTTDYLQGVKRIREINRLHIADLTDVEDDY